MANYLGSSTADAQAGDGNTAVTIPSGTTFGVIMLAFWDANTGAISDVSVDSIDATDIFSNDRNVNASGTYLGTIVPTSTGEKTMAWTWTTDGAVDEGGSFYVTWWSGVDTTALSDSGSAAAETSGAVQVTVTTAASETVVGLCESFTATTPELTPDGTPTVVQVFDDDAKNSHITDVDYYVRTQVTHVNDMDNEDYSSMIIAVLKEAAVTDLSNPSHLRSFALTRAWNY